MNREKLVAQVSVEGAARDLYEGSQLPKVIMVARARVTRALTDLECTPWPAQVAFGRWWAYLGSITDLMAL